MRKINHVKLIENPPYYALLEIGRINKRKQKSVRVYNVTRRIHRALKAVKLWKEKE